MSGNHWPPERVEQLRDLCAVRPPLSWLQIDRRLGGGNSPRSVKRIADLNGITKLNATWRVSTTPPQHVAQLEVLLAEGLTFAAAAARLGITKNAAIGLANRRGLRSVRHKPLLAREPVVTLEPRIEFPPAQFCQWPFGDPRDDDFHFCAEPAVWGTPYCHNHNQIAWQKPREAA